MDNDQKKLATEENRTSNNSLVEFDFIKDKPHLIYLIKKAEKLAGAVHLVTSALSQTEPLRTELRGQCLLLLKNILQFERKTITETSLESTVAECISLLDIGRSSLLISQMNVELLRAEFVNLLPILNALYMHERSHVSFDQEAFLVPPVEFASTQDEVHVKGQFKKENVLYTQTRRVSNVPRVEKKPTKILSHGVESTRDRLILDVIRAKGTVSIKDITTLIHGVSEKTIQRDLVQLVSKGVLQKSGKRRWSRYSLV